ncbi:MAG: helix-turn-helix domain-containing protein, partial [Caldilinea sp.]
NKQSRAMRQHVGAVRWAYNWGLERIKQAAMRSASVRFRMRCAISRLRLTTGASARRGNARGRGWSFPSARPASTDWALAASPEPSRCWMDASSCRASASCV